MDALATRRAVSCCHRALLAPSGTAAPSRALLTTTPRPTTSPAAAAAVALGALSLPSGARTKATAARTRRALRIQPHYSFLHPPNKPGYPAYERPTTDEIIFNPPSSAASVYHTPVKFLPKADPRRRTAALVAAAAGTGSSTPSGLVDLDAFPTVNMPDARPRHHLTKADIEEMRRLRTADPVTNSVVTLARRYECSQLFVLMCCHAPPAHRAKMREEEAKVRARWGPRRRSAREERARRNLMLQNGEL
ncbi:mitochondrial ribosomal protein subunit L20-domain-containing protein [Staphylotrichum tortipilum]|uniref:Mitochondrial ribosomal protein subunit L20-domain-containing protein n=1 Tax=Staphylotrichum tortipilum TaxID=2831512 RepID=A0AAN6RP44_9PEZI|nr:mitochondrial ribosomal protein subunit L20-domain-containing protein [Staphylotrichum longicolle]